MAGVKLWEFYIRLPQDIVDDPDIDLSLNAYRLITYLCRHQLRLGKTQIRMTQDEVLNGRKEKGVRVDRGSRITGSRNLAAGRDELIALGWIKYFNLEGAFVYELIIQEQPPQVQNAPEGQVQNAPKRRCKLHPESGAKRTRNQVQIAPAINNKELHKTQEHKKGGSDFPASGFNAALEAVKISDARQPDLLQSQPALIASPSGEDFNSIEVAHALCVEFGKAGHEIKMLLDEALKNYRAKNPALTWQQCGENLIALWREYDALTARELDVKFKFGFKGFFSEGEFLKKEKWRKATAVSPMRSATDVLRERRERLSENQKGDK